MENREIKFRGKSKFNNEWWYGYYIYSSYEDKHYIVQNAIDNNSPNGSVSFSHFSEIYPESIGQLWNPSEGLYFYTGDLFTAICSPSGSNKKIERICKIDFDGRGMNVSVWYKKEWWHYGSMNFTTFKKIGNIHENPELLNTQP